MDTYVGGLSKSIDQFHSIIPQNEGKGPYIHNRVEKMLFSILRVLSIHVRNYYYVGGTGRGWPGRDLLCPPVDDEDGAFRMRQARIDKTLPCVCLSQSFSIFKVH